LFVEVTAFGTRKQSSTAAAIDRSSVRSLRATGQHATGGLRGEDRYTSFGAAMLEKFSHAVGADGYQRVLVLAPTTPPVGPE